MGKPLSRRAFVAGLSAAALAAVGASAARDSAAAVRPEQFGAAGDGSRDDTDAIQAALDTGWDVTFAPSGRFLISRTLETGGGKAIDLNGSTIDCGGLKYSLRNSSAEADADVVAYDGHGDLTVRNGTILKGSVLLSHAQGVTLENIEFRDCAHNHWVQACAMKDLVVEGCSFVGMRTFTNRDREYFNFDNAVYGAFPYFKKKSAAFDGTPCQGVTISNCFFGQGTSRPYHGGYVAVGAHTIDAEFKHSGIIIVNNRFSGFRTAGVTVNAMQDVYIAGNAFEGMAKSIDVATRSDVSDVVIEDNDLCATDGGDGIVLGNHAMENVLVQNNRVVAPSV